jgi:DNA-directed RNA polymerase subunit M/transcription elongation factor TFIIS
MYYIRIISSPDEPDRLEHYCRLCGNKEDNLVDISVSKTILKKNEQKYSHIINEYTKLDPTLPRINTLDCPNPECTTNHNETSRKEKEIIYIRYDDINMKYVYMCSTCDTVWKLEQ